MVFNLFRVFVLSGRVCIAGLLFLAGSGGLVSCSKGADAAPVLPDTPGTEVQTGLYTLVNLAADTLASSGGDAQMVFYSLEQNKMIPAAQRSTTNWDIAFGGIYNSSVYVNNGQAKLSPGYGGAGKGGMYLVVDRKFDAQFYDTLNYIPKVLPVPAQLFDSALHIIKSVDIADAQFISNNLISLDHFQGSGDGWGYYDFYGTLFPNDAKKAHIVYTLPRAILIKTAKGHYAKIVIKSIYKDAPANPNRDNKPGYLSFSYVIQMDGSKNLDIK